MLDFLEFLIIFCLYFRFNGKNAGKSPFTVEAETVNLDLSKIRVLGQGIEKDGGVLGNSFNFTIDHSGNSR